MYELYGKTIVIHGQSIYVNKIDFTVFDIYHMYIISCFSFHIVRSVDIYHMYNNFIFSFSHCYFILIFWLSYVVKKLFMQVYVPFGSSLSSQWWPNFVYLFHYANDSFFLYVLSYMYLMVYSEFFEWGNINRIELCLI